MNCKNCKSELNQKDNFCKECGAKIIRNRITIKSLFSNLIVAFGWDSNFFVTLRHLVYKPQIVINEYINGTRKKYANPISFFAIMLAISLFIFNQYSEQLIEISTDTVFQQTETIESTLSDNIEETKDKEIFGFKNQNEFNKGNIKFMMKYYNLLSFLLLPLYTLVAFLVFRKPFNYGEHLVINTYLQSILTLLSVLLFVFSLITGINIYINGVLILPFLYYCYVYKRLYKLTYGQLLLKTLKFIGISLVFAVLLSIVIVVYAVLNKYIT